MNEIIREIWQLKWWEIMRVSAACGVFLLAKAWFIWVGLLVIGLIAKFFRWI